MDALYLENNYKNDNSSKSIHAFVHFLCILFASDGDDDDND